MVGNYLFEAYTLVGVTGFDDDDDDDIICDKTNL